MSVPADSFPKAAFDGIEFAYSAISLKGGIRYALHEFPHAAGAEPEKMGRKAYIVSFRAFFHDIPKTALDREYPDAYPNSLRILREKFESQITGDLTIPTVGKIKAVAIDWTQQYDVRSPTGESFDIEFVEDQAASFLIAAIGTSTNGAIAVEEASNAAFAAAALADFKKKNTHGFFQSLNDAVNLFKGALGAGDAFSRVLEGKIQGLVNLCAFADSQLEEMQHPSNHLVVTALKDLALAAKQFGENITQSSQRILLYTVPRMMTIGQVSTVLYGTSEKGSDILLLNTVADAFAIPAGTQLRYLSKA